MSLPYSIQTPIESLAIPAGLFKLNRQHPEFDHPNKKFTSVARSQLSLPVLRRKKKAPQVSADGKLKPYVLNMEELLANLQESKKQDLTSVQRAVEHIDFVPGMSLQKISSELQSNSNPIELSQNSSDKKASEKSKEANRDMREEKDRERTERPQKGSGIPISWLAAHRAPQDDGKYRNASSVTSMAQMESGRSNRFDRDNKRSDVALSQESVLFEEDSRVWQPSVEGFVEEMYNASKARRLMEHKNFRMMKNKHSTESNGLVSNRASLPEIKKPNRKVDECVKSLESREEDLVNQLFISEEKIIELGQTEQAIIEKELSKRNRLKTLKLHEGETNQSERTRVTRELALAEIEQANETKREQSELLLELRRERLGGGGVVCVTLAFERNPQKVTLEGSAIWSDLLAADWNKVVSMLIIKPHLLELSTKVSPCD